MEHRHLTAHVEYMQMHMHMHARVHICICICICICMCMCVCVAYRVVLREVATVLGQVGHGWPRLLGGRAQYLGDGKLVSTIVMCELIGKHVSK